MLSKSTLRNPQLSALKKLPIDILIEVNDHFVFKFDLQREENLSFEEAF